MRNAKIFIAMALTVVFVTDVICDKVCHGTLGCFSNDPPFTSALLPEPLLPESRDVVNVAYSLFIRHQITPSSRNAAPNAAFNLVNVSGPHSLSYDMKPGRRWRPFFVVAKPTKIIVHDYGDSSLNPWVFAMVERFLAREDCHVITVNWNSRDGATGYYQATANARLVGAEIASLLRNIQEWKEEFEFESVHVIGHGVGAHAASYVGETLKVEDIECMTTASKRGDVNDDDSGSHWWQLPSWLRSSKPKKEPEPVVCSTLPVLGQITGLDPAGLWFESAGPVARLDSSDAIFVDVIHTDVMKKLTTYFGHGISRASGNIDFYPNAGYGQPGCEGGVSGLEDLQYPGSVEAMRPMDCNHVRSISYYLTTMIPGACPMTSFPCGSWGELCRASCTSCIHNFESRVDEESFSPSGLLQYFGYWDRSRRTSAPRCLQLGPTAAEYWQEHQRRAKATKSDVTNINAYLKTSATAPYCLKYVRIELELNELWSEGSLSFRITDNSGRKTKLKSVGRVSNWGSTDRPTYLVTIPSTFGHLRDVEVVWKMTVVTSWWPGIGGRPHHQAGDRKELRFPLRKIKITEPPQNDITTFCSPRRRLRSGREVRFTRCGSEEYQQDLANYAQEEG